MGMIFKYLGSVLEASGGIVKEVGERIAIAIARFFGALKGPVFSNSNLSYKMKRMVYKAVVCWYTPVWFRDMDHQVKYDKEAGSIS